MQIAARYQNRFLVSDSVLLNLLLIILGSVVLALASQISIPWQPVPFTLQSTIVALLGLALGARRAVSIVTLYLLEGALGLPVFAGFTFGLPILLGTTAGYLIGFLPAAFIAGWLMEKGFAKNIVSTFMAGLISVSVIFICGVLHLQALIGFKQAILFGVKPFLITEPLKLLLMTWMAKGCWTSSKK